MSAIREEDFEIPFTDATKAQGQSLFDDGDVTIMEGARDGAWEARVRFFRRHHDVWIERTANGRLEHECSCPFLENEGSGCAHLWALVLAAGREILEDSWGAAGPPPITPVYRVLRHSKRMKMAMLWPGDDDGALRPLPADGEHLSRVTDPRDLRVIAALEPIAGGKRNLMDGGGFVESDGPWTLLADGRADVLAAAAATGRLELAPQPDAEDPTPETIEVDPGKPYELLLGFESDEDAARLKLAGWLVRDDARLRLDEADAVAADRAPQVILDGRVRDVQAHGAEEWLALLAKGRAFPVGHDEIPDVLERLAAAGPLPRIAPEPDGPPLAIERGAPVPRARIVRRRSDLIFDLTFGYGPHEVPPESGQRLLLDATAGRQWQRDLDGEAAVARRLDVLDGVETDDGVHGRWFVDPRALETVVAKLLADGFEVTAEDRRYRAGSTPSFELATGIDWFEARGEVTFGDGGTVSLSKLVAAWRSGRPFVALDDGSEGLVPAAWLEKVGGVLEMGQDVEGGVRFHRAHAPLLAPLSDAAGVAAPDGIDDLLESLTRLQDPPAVTPTSRFTAELRPYQAHGVGWLRELSAAGLGGCLADDMGLGKTIQALGFLSSLESDPPAQQRSGPVLLVAPRSLLWNWCAEAERFCEGRKLVVHHGPGRSRNAQALVSDSSPWVMTTYGTLQRDIQWLSHVPWSVVVLDEAQAIKNPKSKSAQAVHKLDAHTRVAMTGTPVENHARDLWSLMAFLAPGLLGSERRFLERTGRNADPETRALLARAIAPLVLRRTKEEVAPELPERLEQTLLVPLSDQQSELYETLRAAGEKALAPGDAAATNKLHVLETLLRLRQVASHPALVDPERQDSGKIDLLMNELDQVVAGGHKALVFSQFVKLLDLVAPRLDAAGIAYTRLDGSTRDRARVVGQFQDDDQCSVLLISLKAGGHGLNLTAADYVFLLDPWWNPAVESQAIDRAHRIGRTRRVIAYRLVARDTVEERILDLQQSKRDLADALLGDARGPLADLTADDLKMLLA